MLSLLDVLLLVLSATSASASPVRRWLNSSSEAVTSSSSLATLPLNTTAKVEHAAANAAYATTSDDCEDMSTTVVYSSPTWPAALSTIQAQNSVSMQHGAYGGSEAAPATTQQYQEASTPAAYVSSIAQPTSQSSSAEGPPSYTVTSVGNHANATASVPSSSYGAAKPYESLSLSGTTTLTLYTTIGSIAGSSSSTPVDHVTSSSASSVPSNTAERGLPTYGGQTTSMAAYTNPSSSSASQTRARGHHGPGGPPMVYGSHGAPAYGSPDASSSYPEPTTRARHRPHGPPHEASLQSTSPIAQYSTTTEQAASSPPPAYTVPASSSSSSAPGSSVTVDPVPATYVPPSQAYSYSPQTSTTTTSTTASPANPPVLPTSQASSQSQPSPTDSYATDFPFLPTMVTSSPSTAVETTTSSSSSSSSTLLAGITIVPVDPHATTVYVTVTTTEAGMTTTLAWPTVTQCS